MEEEKVKRPYVQRKKGCNPMQARFRLRSNANHERLIRCHRVDDLELSWACHQKIFTKGQNYVKHVTEWFEKALWENVSRGYVAPKKPKVEKPFEPPKEAKAPADAPPRMDESRDPRPQKTESPKNPPPPIDEDDEPTAPLPPGTSPIIAGRQKQKYDIKEEAPGEYNPLAHKENLYGKPEDLIVLDEMVDSNYIAQRRKEKLLDMKRRQRVVDQVSPMNPCVSGVGKI
jgi:hypothetical protein